MIQKVSSWLSQFFIGNNVVDNAEAIFFTPSLIILYLSITILGAYTGLSVTREMYENKILKTNSFLKFYASFVLGAGMWVMHFVGMLSHDVRIDYHYSLLANILLIVANTSIAYISIHIISRFKPSFSAHISAAITFSFLIIFNYYLNVILMDIQADIFFKPFYFIASSIAAFATALIMIFFMFSLKKSTKRQLSWYLYSSILAGLALTITHYIATKSLVILPQADCCDSDDLGVSILLIGFKVSVIIFSLAVLFRVYLLKHVNKKEKYEVWDYVPRLIVFLGIIITAISIFSLDSFSKKQDQIRFQSFVNDTESALIERYSRYEQALRGAKGFFTSSEYVSREEWRSFTDSQDIKDALPGINGIGFIEYVLEEDLPDFLNKTREEYPKFKNHPPTEFSDKFIIKYIEPENINESAIGLDIGFEENRRAAAEYSIRTGNVSLTHKIDLVQDDVKRAGFLMLYPLDKVDGKFLGWVYAPFIGEKYLKDLRVNDEITYSVHDGDVISPQNVIFTHTKFSSQYCKKQISYKTQLNIAGKTWTIVWQTTPEFKSATNTISQLALFVIGMLITALLVFIAYSQNYRNKIITNIIKNKTKELVAERKFSDLIIDTIPDIFFVKDNEFNIVRHNDPFLSLYPDEAHENLLGTTGISNHDPKEVELYLKEDRKAFAEGISNVIETITRFDDVAVTLNTTKVRFENEQGEAFILGVARDVSALQNAKENLELLVSERTKELEEANASKDMFLANMSHELRTPLNSILGLIKLLLMKDNMPDDYKDTLVVIERSASSLLEIVNDILDLSKIEADKIKIENKPFNVSGLMFSLLEMVIPLASQKGLTLSSNIDELEELNVIGDEFRLSRIILNLISNAIKYTPEGNVEIKIKVNHISDNNVEFIFDVIDTGIGIPEDKIEHIFEKFTQAEETTERNFGGTGLGLNITKKLLNLMGGSIKVKSKLGEGSTFSFMIPFETIDNQEFETSTNSLLVPKKEKNRIPLEKATILIAEDHEFNQIFIMKLLRQYGCNNFELVVNGAEAIKEAITNKYDAILMDCHMPKMNGYTATKEIRKIEKSDKDRKYTPIIAMTADAMVGTRDACLEAGMDEYISKPVDIDHFKTILERWFIFKGEIEKPIVKPKADKALSLINLEILNDYTGGDENQNKQLLAIFYEKSLEDIEQLSKHVVDGKSEEWSRHAHGLKGASAYVGADALYRLAEQGQNMLNANKTDREELLEQIKANHSDIHKYLIKNNFIS